MSSEAAMKNAKYHFEIFSCIHEPKQVQTSLRSRIQKQFWLGRKGIGGVQLLLEAVLIRTEKKREG